MKSVTASSNFPLRLVGSCTLEHRTAGCAGSSASEAVNSRIASSSLPSSNRSLAVARVPHGRRRGRLRPCGCHKPADPRRARLRPPHFACVGPPSGGRERWREQLSQRVREISSTCRRFVGSLARQLMISRSTARQSCGPWSRSGFAPLSWRFSRKSRTSVDSFSRARAERCRPVSSS